MDGRVLSEALVDSDAKPVATEKTLEAQRDLGDSAWHQHLRTATVTGVTYFMEGNGGRQEKKP
jgi:hypothetical protein